MKTELIFPDKQSLWAFESTIEGLPIKIDIASATLQRNCSFDQIYLARTLYNATEVRVARNIQNERNEPISEDFIYLIDELKAKLLAGWSHMISAKTALTKLATKRFADYKFHQLIK